MRSTSLTERHNVTIYFYNYFVNYTNGLIYRPPVRPEKVRGNEKRAYHTLQPGSTIADATADPFWVNSRLTGEPEVRDLYSDKDPQQAQRAHDAHSPGHPVTVQSSTRHGQQEQPAHREDRPQHLTFRCQ